MKFNLIISNPPYNRIGAKITSGLIINVEFDKFVNLMPAADYKKYPNLWRHVRPEDIKNINGGLFEDASVTSSIMEVHKDKVNSLSKFQFTLAVYLDRSLDKYFLENNKRKPVFTMTERERTADIHHTLFLPMRVYLSSSLCATAPDMVSLGRTKKSAFYQVARNKINDWNELRGKDKQLVGTRIIFKTPEEKNNAVRFLYTEDGFKFASKCFFSMQRDQMHEAEHGIWFPRVDWSKSWTLTDILKEYNYSEAEINAILSDLHIPGKYRYVDEECLEE